MVRLLTTDKKAHTDICSMGVPYPEEYTIRVPEVTICTTFTAQPLLLPFGRSVILPVAALDIL